MFTNLRANIMSNRHQIKYRVLMLIVAISILTTMSALMHADTGSCDGASITLPFTDVAAGNVFFCSIAEAYFSGLTNGTSSTTYNPSSPVPREQMAAFVTRTQDGAIKRANKRAFMQQWWTPTEAASLRSTSITNPVDIVFDGLDLWVSSFSTGTVKRIRASDGQVLGTWTGASSAYAIIAAAGRIFVTAQTSPAGKIYVINPDAAPAAVTVFESDIGDEPIAITYDGANLWTANVGSMAGNGSISRVNAATALDSTFTTGFARPWDIFWDGANLWVADGGDNHLKLVDPSSGAVLESIAIDNQPRYLLFDGTNIWVTNFDSNSISVVRAVGSLRGTVLATLTGNGLAFPQGMAFDGERVMVCNNGNGGSLSLFRAADFTPLVNMSTGASSAPRAACSDGVNFWIARTGNNDIARF
jgi:hypothetical protein